MNQQMIRKTLPASVAIKSLDEQGWFEGYASTFGNADLVGDTFQKGAFRRTLSHKGGKVPILLNHQKDLIAGYNYEAREDDHGLWVRGKLNLSSEAGKTAHFLLLSAQEAGGDGGLSIGFTVPSGGAEKKKSEPGYIYKECALKEYSVTPWNCNPEALVTSVKNHEELPERTKTLSLPAITIEQALKASRGESAELSPEQLAGLTAFADLINVSRTDEPATEQPKEPTMPTNQKDAAGLVTFESALSQANRERDLQNQRWMLEEALSDAIGSVQEADMTAGDKKLAISRALGSYSNALTDWYGQMIDAENAEMSSTKAIKGMNTATHMEMQNKVARAKMHMDEASAQRSSADSHAKKAHNLMRDAISAYAAADVQAPNGPALGIEGEPTPGRKKADEFDLSVLFKSLSIAE